MLLQGGTQMRVLKVEKKAYFGSGIPEYNDHDAERAVIFDDMDDRLEELSDETLKQAGVHKTDDRLNAVNKLTDYELMKKYGKNKGYIVYMETIDTKPLINR